MRLFAAVFPPEPVLDHLGRALDAVRAVPPDAPGRAASGGGPRWVPREALHLTLAFYGDVPQGAVPELREDLAAVAARTAPCDVRLRGAGAFLGRVLWIGVDGATDAVRDLAQQCLAASPREVPEDVRPHRAHVTVARARRGRAPSGGSRRRGRVEPAPLDPPARALAVYAGPAWTVDGFALVESRPGEGPQGGPLYREVERWRLGGR